MNMVVNKELFYTKLVRLIKNSNEKMYVKISQNLWAVYYDAIEQRGKKFCHVCGSYNCNCDKLSKPLQLVDDKELLNVMANVEKLDKEVKIDVSNLLNPTFLSNEILSNFSNCNFSH